MKRSLLILSFLAIALGSNAQNSIIKTNPLGLAFGVFNACYEKVISEKASIQPSASAFFGIGEAKTTAFGVGLGYRRYLTKKPAPQGFYVMPSAGVSFGEGAGAISLGLPLGYQWAWESGFVLDIGIGPAYYIGYADDVDDAFSGIGPTGTLAIGYAF